jgi:hypothetical protein
MPSPDDEPLERLAIERWLLAGECRPRLSAEWRARVLTAGTSTHRRYRRFDQVQGTLSGLLAVALLLGLPAYYQSLRTPVSAQSAPALALQPASLPRVILQNSSGQADDAFEWRLVEEQLVLRDYSARVIRSLL